MAILLGIDTGGTYTDAVLLDDSKDATQAVVASAKALTTRHDLSIGIGEAIANVCEAQPVLAKEIALVSLSTTLATNAVVEAQGGRVGLVLIGLGEKALERADLKAALGDDPYVAVVGGHNAHGGALHDVDLQTVERWLDEIGAGVSGYAVAGEFAVRNPEHERAVRDLILKKTGKAATCSHELSSKLDGPRRALTSVLNARLIGLIHDLIASTETLMAARGIEVPMMVVRGDGALIAAEVAKTCPVETILSGPAASLVGAAYLTNAQSGVVSDIGGTTTDVAILRDGVPRLDPAGATVGGWRTMVEAVAMWTVGLGGDSEVTLKRDGLAAGLALGPRRAVPVSLLARDHTKLVLDTLKRQARKDRVDERDGMFALQVRDAGIHVDGLRDVEKKLIDALSEGPVPLDKLISVRMQLGALEKLVSRGLVMISTMTPSDAAHVLGIYENWNVEAARLAAKIFAGRRDARGHAIAEDGEALSGLVIDTLTHRSAETLLDAAFAEDGFGDMRPSELPVVHAGLKGHAGVVRLDVGLASPVIGLGASAETYYPAVADALRTKGIIPPHAEVANAVGAVVGQVRVSAEALISQPEAGRYRLHLPETTETFADLAIAYARGEEILEAHVRQGASDAGAGDINVAFSKVEKKIQADGQDIFVEAILVAEATGRPRFSS